MPILAFSDLKKRNFWKFDDVDFCVIGSGAGGSVVACELARSGKKVLVLERGKHYRREDMTMREFEMFAKLFDPDIFHTVGEPETSLPLLRGDCLGGSTLLADAICFDPPSGVLRVWERMGMPTLAPDHPLMRDSIAYVKQSQQIAPVTEAMVNLNNRLLREACKRSGYLGQRIERNITGGECRGAGFCSQGCPYGDKKDSLENFIPWADRAGATFLTECGVKGIELLSGQLPDRVSPGSRFLIQAEARSRDLSTPMAAAPIPIAVRARNVILCAGAIGSPRIVLQGPSSFNRTGQAGRNLRLHYHTPVAAQWENLEIDAFLGVPGSYECTEFCDVRLGEPGYDGSRHGFWMEASFAHPWNLATSFDFAGKAMVEMMDHYRRLAFLLLHVRGDSVGRVTKTGVSFKISPEDNERMVLGARVAAGLYFKIGAAKVYVAAAPHILERPEDIRHIGEGGGYRSRSAITWSAHLMGGLCMGADPEKSATNENGEIHGVKGLYAADASLFPTALGIHPYVAVMALAKKVSQHLKTVSL